ncbi:MAG: bifunctional (p)ppGpp synthetase/guanosine-3',5'-bis(diphosphate) 3'-pyrophosphohydrolase [Pseudomonadota bacterium]|nr:bifunctional (p)ppGpp synthetase/guanosine-3',5'-bis(diphosphate) 3'-pyrophosphohydrolase [Pseudomonadota bacterium]
MLDQYQSFENKLAYLQKDHIRQVKTALVFATDAHTGQLRKSGLPYITHPIAVAEILATLKMDVKCIMAGILHDVLEDTPFKYSDIEKRFDKEIADLVNGVTKIKKIPTKSRKEHQAESFRKMLMAICKDIRVLIIKLADRLHNMRTLDVLEGRRKARIASETLDIYAPLAKRLGINFIAIELEQLGFANMYPLRYRVLNNAVEALQGERRSLIASLTERIEAELNKNNVSYEYVKGRKKHVYSIFRKMRDNGLPFAEICDVFAIRVCVTDRIECYRTLGIVHTLYKPVPNSFKDYIALPKANGYQSLHTILFGPGGVNIEIQVRTQEMDKMANTGVAAHCLYKSRDKKFSEGHLQAQQWLNRLMAMQKQSGSSLEFIEHVKIDLCPEEVYVFTPLGDIIELPAGACVIDYAYSIHTRLGHRCVSAKINQKICSLSTVLESGQTVQVITRPDATPHQSWLDFVVSGKAKASIRFYFKMQHRGDLLKLGTRMVAKLCQIELDPVNMPKGVLQRVRQYFKFKHSNEIFESVALGNLPAMAVAKKITAELKEAHIELDTLADSGRDPLVITGHEHLAINYATCCNPIPGDPITGLLIVGKGVYVHHKKCQEPSAKECQDAERMKVEWAKNLTQFFQVALEVHVVNQRGTLAAVAMSVAQDNADICDIALCTLDNNSARIDIRLMVKNRLQLSAIVRKMRREKCVLKIKRSI